MYEAMNHEYTRYIETGNVFAEPCLDLPCITTHTPIHTLFDREDKIYPHTITLSPPTHHDTYHNENIGNQPVLTLYRRQESAEQRYH